MRVGRGGGSWRAAPQDGSGAAATTPKAIPAVPAGGLRGRGLAACRQTIVASHRWPRADSAANALTIGQHAPAVRPDPRSTRRRWWSSRTRLFPRFPTQPFPPQPMILQAAAVAWAVARPVPSNPPSIGRKHRLSTLPEKNGIDRPKIV